MAPKSDKLEQLSGTDLVHADDARAGPEVGPSISVSTTFKYPDPSTNPAPFSEWDPLKPETKHIYARYTQNVSTRAEKVLSEINNGYALTYSSGLASSYAALISYQPKCIAITDGYHGYHKTIALYRKTRQDVEIIGIDDEFKEGTFCWLETPLNPIGESRDIQYYADKVHAVGGRLVVDSTFAPPPLQYPFKWGADIIMHSGTKYFGGHSDLLCGVLVVKTREEWMALWDDRSYLGNVMGNLESWLLLRSLRTLHLRVPRQSATATALAKWLAAATGADKPVDGIPAGVITKVWHSSLQGTDKRGFDPAKQMEGGWNATFSIQLANAEQATLLPHSLKYFVPATSLGGVESLIEQRFQVVPEFDPKMLRISVGVENLEDLKDDLRNGLQVVALKVHTKL